MVFVKSVLLSSIASLALSAASTNAPYEAGDDWRTLTPDTPSPSNAIGNFSSTFGIAPVPITDSEVLSSISEDSTRTTTLSSTTTSVGESSSSSFSYAEPSSTVDPETYIKSHAKKSEGTLQLSLNDTILYDSQGRVGSIVANRQFQFDGPPPQAGALYAVGWTITEDGNLAIGDNDVFYQCLSGSFYNLYDEHIGSDCRAIYLEVIGLTD